MEWLLPIACSLGCGMLIVAFGFLFCHEEDNVLAGVLGVVFALWVLSFIVICIAAPMNYCWQTKNNALRAEAYWDSVQPCVVSRSDDHVLVHSSSGVWQAGGNYNVTSYNQYIETTRHWRSVHFVKWFVHPVPEGLKYIQLTGGE